MNTRVRLSIFDQFDIFGTKVGGIETFVKGFVKFAPDDFEVEVVGLTEIEIGKLAGRPRRAFVEAKKMLLGPVWTAMKSAPPEGDQAFLDCWFEPETQERIEGVATRLGQG